MSLLVSKKVVVNVTTATKNGKSLAKGNLTSNGSEQTLAELVGEGSIYGSVCLDEMVEGDTVVIRQYVKLMDGYPYQMYGEEIYAGIQALPVVYFPAKATTVALKITLKQTAGDFRRYRHDFLWEE